MSWGTRASHLTFLSFSCPLGPTEDSVLVTRLRCSLGELRHGNVLCKCFSSARLRRGLASLPWSFTTSGSVFSMAGQVSSLLLPLLLTWLSTWRALMNEWWMDGQIDRWMDGWMDGWIDELPLMQRVLRSNQQLESRTGGVPPGKCMALPRGCTCHGPVSRMWVGTSWLPRPSVSKMTYWASLLPFLSVRILWLKPATSRDPVWSPKWVPESPAPWLSELFRAWASRKTAS